MWADIFTKPLQGREFMDFRAELMKFPVDYEDGSTCEYLVNTTVVSDTNGVHKGKSNVCYRSYAEATRVMIKSEVPGRARRTRFPRDTGFSNMMTVT